MIDLRDVSVITSATIDSPDRLRNARLFLRYFETFCLNYEIIIAEHDTESKLGELTSGREGVLLHFLESENCHSRSKNLNRAAVLAERSILLVCDLDVFIPPAGLEKALAKVRSGTDFLFPYNGIMVQIRQGAIDEEMDLQALMDSLVFFNQLHEIRPPKFDPEIFEVLYGSAQSNAFGGTVICNRRKFFLAGAMNENLRSFGFEDLEFFHRIRKLNYSIDRLEESNAYHYEHTRSTDSLRNNFHSWNEAELALVKAMEPAELRRYADSGFMKVKLDTKDILILTNTPTEFTVKLANQSRIKLTDTCIILLFDISPAEDVMEVEAFFDHMEANFDDYSIFVVEREVSRFCSCLIRKYTRHIRHLAPFQDTSEEQIRRLVCTERSDLAVYRFENRFDRAELTRRYNPANFPKALSSTGADDVH